MFFLLVAVPEADLAAVNKRRQGIFKKAMEDENREIIRYLYENKSIEDPSFDYQEYEKKFMAISDDDEEQQEGEFDANFGEVLRYL